MELSDFSSPSFDAKEWINRKMKRLSNEDCSESVTSIAMKLQEYFDQLNTEFESTAQNVLQNLPRVMKETEMLADEAKELRIKMDSVKQEIAKVERDTGASIAALEKMDSIKMELMKAEQALREADRWTALTMEVRELLDTGSTGDIDVIASKLMSMQQSLHVLSNVADYEDKKMHLDGLKNRLEALASPHLVQAFTSKSIEQSRKFVIIFQDMNRLSQLLKYYTECQKAMLLNKWQEIIETEVDENIQESLQSYYSILVVNWQEQVRWCDSVLPQVSVGETLIDLYTDLLMTLSPEFVKLIHNNVKQMAEPLTFLSQLKKSSQQFAINIKGSLSKLKIKDNHILKLVKAIYSPYVTHISKYGSYQEALFHQQLSLLLITYKPERNVIDSVQNLGQLNSEVLTIVSNAEHMCMKLTEGCSYVGFSKAVEWFLTSYLDHYKPIIQDISKFKNDDVNMFQMCVTILQNLGDFVNGVKKLDEDSISTLNELKNKFLKSESDPFSQYLKFLLDAEKEKEFKTTMSRVLGMSEPSLFKPIVQSAQRVCREIHQTTFDITFAPIETLLNAESLQLSLASKGKHSGLSPDLPDYSFVPQEYITQIGQYLLNLPQLLEPFLLSENPSLTLALSMVGPEYAHLVDGASDDNGFAETFLGKVAEATCRTYSGQILGIDNLSVHACKQLVTDINYLGNVFEDLGFVLTEKMQHIVLLLKLTPAEYSTQSGCPPQLVAAIRQMRNIISE